MTPDTEALVHEYLPLAKSLAQQVWRTAPHALELDELTAIAYLGLVGAARRWQPYCAQNRFDPGRLEFFKPFVVRRVRGALMDAIRQADWATRSLRTKAKAIQQANAQERGLSEQEVAERAGLSVEQVRATRRDMAHRPVSLEAEELDPASIQNVESSAFTSTILTAVVAIIRALPTEQQVVVALHYHRGMQLQEIAKTMGITESRASQLHARSVTTIHAAMLQAADLKDD